MAYYLTINGRTAEYATLAGAEWAARHYCVPLSRITTTPVPEPANARAWLDYLTELAVQAGADPVRARERMAQAAQALALVGDLDGEGKAAE